MNIRNEKRGAFALSAIICSIMVITAINGAFFKNAPAEQILWICFVAWIALFFAYCVTKIVSGRRRARENLIKNDNWSSNCGDILKTYD